MAINSATVLQALDQASEDAAEAVQAAEDQAAALERELDDLIAHRGATLVELARHYLPAITQQSIDETFAGVREDLQNIIARKQRQERILREKLADVIDARDRLFVQLGACTNELNECVEQRGAAEAELAARLEGDVEFQRLAADLAQARIQLTENERRLAEIHSEAREKLPAYENSRLFQYLVERHYAEPEYRGRGLTRRLDRWVANLIDFGRARQSYNFLRVTPELADAEVRSRRAELERLDAEVERIERAASQACGLPEIEQRGQRLGSHRDTLLDQLEQNGQQLEPLERELTELTQSQGSFYDEAINRLKEFLEQSQTAILEQRAAATSEPVDDQIVAQVKWLDEKIGQHKQQIPECRRQRQVAEHQVRGLRYVTGRCRRSNIDSERCYFEDGFDIGRLLDQFRNEEIDEHKLLRTIRDHLRFHPTWADEAGKRIEQALENPASQSIFGAAAAVATEGLRRVVKRHERDFTRKRGF